MWPAEVYASLLVVPGPNAMKSYWYGLYSELIHVLFPSRSSNGRFFIELGDYDPDCLGPSVHKPVFSHKVEHLHMRQTRFKLASVFLLGTNGSLADCSVLSKRREADELIRKRLKKIYDQKESTLPILYAVSAFGTRICFYKCHMQADVDADGNPKIEPERIMPGPGESINDKTFDAAPTQMWELDVMEPGCKEELRRIVKEIKDECAVRDIDAGKEEPVSLDPKMSVAQ